jgi:hypothetical protein
MPFALHGVGAAADEDSAYAFADPFRRVPAASSPASTADLSTRVSDGVYGSLQLRPRWSKAVTAIEKAELAGDRAANAPQTAEARAARKAERAQRRREREDRYRQEAAAAARSKAQEEKENVARPAPLNFSYSAAEDEEAEEERVAPSSGMSRPAFAAAQSAVRLPAVALASASSAATPPQPLSFAYEQDDLAAFVQYQQQQQHAATHGSGQLSPRAAPPHSVGHSPPASRWQQHARTQPAARAIDSFVDPDFEDAE